MREAVKIGILFEDVDERFDIIEAQGVETLADLPNNIKRAL